MIKFDERSLHVNRKRSISNDEKNTKQRRRLRKQQQHQTQQQQQFQRQQRQLPTPPMVHKLIRQPNNRNNNNNQHTIFSHMLLLLLFWRKMSFRCCRNQLVRVGKSFDSIELMHQCRDSCCVTLQHQSKIIVLQILC